MGLVRVQAAVRDSVSPKGSSHKRQAVVAAARDQFFKFGYRRVTMNDIAKTAKMSRPALYLIFPSKEKIFSAVVLQLAQELSDRARALAAAAPGPKEKLRAVFNAWAIESFDLYCGSSEARELHDASVEFTPEALLKSVSMLELDLVRALQSVPTRTLPEGVSKAEIAHLLASSLDGFKRTCRSASELGDMVDNMLRLTVRG
jgi:AcrR family transcriptional regulator